MRRCGIGGPCRARAGWTRRPRRAAPPQVQRPVGVAALCSAPAGGGGGRGVQCSGGGGAPNYWAPLTRKRHTPPHPAQPRHTNYWAPRTRKRHQREHRPQRPTERSDPTQHAKGRAGDCPGPRKETTTGRNVTQGGGGGGPVQWGGGERGATRWCCSETFALQTSDTHPPRASVVWTAA